MTRVDVEDVRACVDELIGRDRLLERVAGLLFADQDAEVSGRGRAARRRVESPAPWNEAAADVLFAVHAGAREVEADLSRLLFSRRLVRSGSDVHTRRALRNIPDLVAVAADRFPGHWALRQAPGRVEVWPRSCRLLLDEARWGESRWTNAPGGLRCPHCSRRLVLAPGWEREADPPVWCRGCPARLEGDRVEPGRGVHREWPSGAWIATLNGVAP